MLPDPSVWKLEKQGLATEEKQPATVMRDGADWTQYYEVEDRHRHLQTPSKPTTVFFRNESTTDFKK